MNNKRVLIISHNALSLHANNGKTLNSLFANWNTACVAQLFFQDEIPESDRFQNFFRIRDVDILKNLAFIKNREACGGEIKSQKRVYSHYESAGTIKKWLVHILRKSGLIKLILRDLTYGTGRWRTKNLHKWLTEFKADSIFFVGGNSAFSFQIANEIASLVNVPLDIFITDDYVINPKQTGVISRYMHHRLLSWYKESFTRARHAFVIGEDMAHVFCEQFNREFIPIMNSVQFPSTPPASKVPGNSIKVVYAGGLHLGRESTILKFASLIQPLSKKIGLQINFIVYTLQQIPNNKRSLYAKYKIAIGGALDATALHQELQGADYVLHIESFEEKYIQLTKLSVSTKLPEYMACGACLIVMGPSEIASIRIVERNHLGFVLTEQDTLVRMEEKLLAAFTNEKERKAKVLSAFNYGKSHFSDDVVRQRFEKLIN